VLVTACRASELQPAVRWSFRRRARTETVVRLREAEVRLGGAERCKRRVARLGIGPLGFCFPERGHGARVMAVFVIVAIGWVQGSKRQADSQNSSSLRLLARKASCIRLLVSSAAPAAASSQTSRHQRASLANSSPEYISIHRV
jgi:hypothetical protein